MKYLLVLYMCSMNTGQCPNSTISGYQFSSHYDCVNAGYALAQSTFRNLKEIEEWDSRRGNGKLQRGKCHTKKARSRERCYQSSRPQSPLHEERAHRQKYVFYHGRIYVLITRETF